jgi:hypothetical protein
MSRTRTREYPDTSCRDTDDESIARSVCGNGPTDLARALGGLNNSSPATRVDPVLDALPAWSLTTAACLCLSSEM